MSIRLLLLLFFLLILVIKTMPNHKIGTLNFSKIQLQLANFQKLILTYLKYLIPLKSLATMQKNCH